MSLRPTVEILDGEPVQVWLTDNPDLALWDAMQLHKVPVYAKLIEDLRNGKNIVFAPWEEVVLD